LAGWALVIVALFLVSMISPVYAGNSLEDLREERETMEEKRETIEERREEEEEELEALKSEEEELKMELKELNDEVEDLEEELENLESDIEDKEEEIEQTERELEEAEERLEYHEDLLSDRMRVMHERGNVSFLEVLLDSTSFADFLTRLQYLQTLTQQDILLVEEVEQERMAIEDKKEDLEDQRNELEGMRRDVVNNKEDLDRTIASRSNVLEDLEVAMEETRQAMEELEEEAAVLESEIEEIRQEQRRRESVGERPEGELLWPVEDPCYITSPFGYRSNPFGGGRTFHGGLDIGTYGQPNRIYAAEDGEVMFTRSQQTGYGNYIMVDHGGGMMTLYAHLRSMDVSEGEQVTRGDTIGRAGTTGASTGVHLHFEVWIDGERKDPMNFLE